MEKRGLSVVIGYILLIAFAMIISAIVYLWLKSYVPAEKLECPDGVSVYIKKANCSSNGTVYNLDLTLQNNGRFELAGYYIRATNSSSQEIAIIDLSSKIKDGGTQFGNSIIYYSGNENEFEINDDRISSFEFEDEIYSITVIPTRFNEIEGRTKFVGCSNAIVSESVNCS